MTKQEKAEKRIIEIMQQLEITAYRVVTFLGTQNKDLGFLLFDELQVYDSYDSSWCTANAYNGETRMLLRELELLVMREKS